jgi:hypothetical protein
MRSSLSNFAQTGLELNPPVSTSSVAGIYRCVLTCLATTVHFKLVNIMICELYVIMLHKSEIRNSKHSRHF